MANVVFETVRGFSPIPIEDAFLKDRKVFFLGEVNGNTCNELIQQLLYLEAQDNTLPITLFINSPGGSVTDGLAVYDTIRLLKSPVHAVVTGTAASMGSIILLAADKERRYMLPNSRIMIHDCSYGSEKTIGGMKPYQVEEELNELQNTNRKLLEIIAERCGKPYEEVAEITKNDHFFTAEESIKFGLVKDILSDYSFADLMVKKGA